MHIQRKYHKEILQIAFPSILSNITVPLLGLSDLAIVGHLGSASYIGAIAIGSTVFNMIYWISAFLRMGTSGMTSQAYGASDKTEMQNLLFRSLSAATAIAILVLGLQRLILKFALFIMSPEPSVSVFVEEYFDICIWGTPAVLGLYCITGWFIGLQNARYPLYVAVIQNVVNIAASLFFVFVLQLNVAGVAWGTLAAQWFGLFLALFYVSRLRSKLCLSGIFISADVFKRSAISRFFTVNRDIFFRTLCLVCVTLYFTSAGAQQSAYILAANALLMLYFTLYSYFMDGFAFAGEALAGKCIGAKDLHALRTIVRALFLWGIGVSLIFTLVYAFGGHGLMQLLTDEPSVRTTAASYLPWVILIPLAGFGAFVWDGIFIGLTATRQMLLSMFGASIVFFTGYFFLFPVWHNHALWLSFLLYLSARSLIQYLLYRNKVLPLQQFKLIDSN